MAMRCNYCGKGRDHGHAVSHAKNRVKRLFKPNLQKLKVLKNGISIHVKFCTKCIKRLKKDKQMGVYSFLSYAAPVAALPIQKPVKSKIAVAKTDELKIEKPKTAKKTGKTEKKAAAAPLKLEDIVGKKI